MLSKDGLKSKILDAMQAQGFSSTAVVQGETQSTGLDKLAEALAQAIVDYFKSNAVAVVPAGTFLVAAQAGVPNPAPVNLVIQ